jgi:hypothetical protein
MLTPAQITALKANLAANTNTVTINGQPVAIKDVPQGGQNAQTIADWYATTASPAYYVFRTDIPPQEIFDQVTWANYTPSDAPDNTVTWSNRSLSCQGKQFNLQILLSGGQTAINAARVNVRAGLNDATTSLPSGASGASRSGGWAGILTILRRSASWAEKLFSVATTGVGTDGGALGTATNPAVMTITEPITGQDVIDAWAA